MIERRVQEAIRELRIGRARADTAARATTGAIFNAAASVSAAASSQASEVPAWARQSALFGLPLARTSGDAQTEDTKGTKDTAKEWPDMRPNEVSYKVIGAAMAVHSALGAGLLRARAEGALP